MRAGFPWLAVHIVVGLWPVAATFGQPAAAVPADSPKSPAAEAVEASQLDTFWLRDGKGNLVPVLGMPFEEFEQLLRTKKGLSPGAAPDFTLEMISVVGTADERVADLQVTATIRVRQAGWVRVPLQLDSAVVRQPAKHEGPGEHFLAYDRALGGYVCWLNGNDAKPHVVTLQISVPISRIGEEQRLALALPRATESSLRLTFAEPTEASLIGGDGIVAMRSIAGRRTEVAVLGAAGDVQLAMRPRREAVKTESSQLDAGGEITVRIQSERRISSDARLRVRSFGPPLESFRVRLPPGMELLPLPPAGGFAISPVSPMAVESNGPQKGPPAQIVEVRLDKPATGTIEVLIRAQREAEVEPTAPFMPARFEVLGAVRQRGTIDFVMDGEWQLDWTEDKSVHRIDVTPDPATARVVARYEYFQQPCGLALKVAARPSRVSVEPTHMVYVDAQRVRIETTLKYRFRGSRAAGLSFDLSDWSFDRLTPDNLLEIAEIRGGEPGRLQVPFLPTAAPPSELELKLEAHRELPTTTENFTLTLPRPLADIVAPATVMILAADNVELTPQIEELVGLSPDPTTARQPGREQPAVVYRELGGGEVARFVAHMRPLARTTTTSARAAVRIDRSHIQVEQQLEYRIAHEPQRTFLLTVPGDLNPAGSLQVWMNGEPLAVSPVFDTTSAAPVTDRVQFSTPSNQIGVFQVAVRYAVPLTWDRKEPLSLAIPLVLPVGEGNDQFGGQQVEFALTEAMTIEPEWDGVEDSDQPVAVGSGAIHSYYWSSPKSLAGWTLEPGQGREATSISVSQMWVQTWLAPQIRQERVAFCVSTLQENIRIKLPKNVRQASVQTAIDAQGVPLGFGGPRVVVVALPAAARGRECVLEVSYSLDPPEPFIGIVNDELETTRIEEAGAPRRVYWQLVLPADEHLVSSPVEWAAEMTWAPGRWLVGQQPVMDQRQLEAWMKASRQQPLPRGVNEYLFGALGRWPTISVTTAHRRVVVSLASAAVLVIGLAWIHLPRLRSPGLLLAIAVAVSAGAFIAPHFALLVGQGAVLGVAVAVGAAVIAWLVSGQAIFSGTPSGTLVARPRETPSTHSAAARPERSSRLSSTAPARAPIMEARP